MKAFELQFSDEHGPFSRIEKTFQNDGEATEYAENLSERFQEKHPEIQNMEFTVEEFNPPVVDFREHSDSEIAEILGSQHPKDIVKTITWDGTETLQKYEVAFRAIQLMRALGYAK